jgi:pyroglutamyl-peptidase
MPTILVTGFGPFPTAPFNPTEALVRRLAHAAPVGVKVVTHVFRTSYDAVDRELPRLIRRHRPDAILMFGLAARTPYLRIETVAANALARLADVDRNAPHRRTIAPDQPDRLMLRTPVRRLLAAARGARVPARVSRDAGRYLCNYLCWRAMEAARDAERLRVVAFIHVPIVARSTVPRPRARKRRILTNDLERAGRGFLRAVASAAQR